MRFDIVALLGLGMMGSVIPVVAKTDTGGRLGHERKLGDISKTPAVPMFRGLSKKPNHSVVIEGLEEDEEELTDRVLEGEGEGGGGVVTNDHCVSGVDCTSLDDEDLDTVLGGICSSMCVDTSIEEVPLNPESNECSDYEDRQKGICLAMVSVRESGRDISELVKLWLRMGYSSAHEGPILPGGPAPEEPEEKEVKDPAADVYAIPELAGSVGRVFRTSLAVELTERQQNLHRRMSIFDDIDLGAGYGEECSIGLQCSSGKCNGHFYLFSTGYCDDVISGSYKAFCHPDVPSQCSHNDLFCESGPGKTQCLRKAGGCCSKDSKCASERCDYSQADSSCSNGKCAPAQEGQKCEDPGRQPCDTGMDCCDGRCIGLNPVEYGGPCCDDIHCESGHVCNAIDPDTGAGFCDDRVAGKLYSFCRPDDPATCTSTSRVCETIGDSVILGNTQCLKSAGVCCANDSQCASGICDTSQNIFSTCASNYIGVCAPAKLGQFCVFPGHHPCDIDMVCLNGACEYNPCADGSHTCSSQDHCTPTLDGDYHCNTMKIMLDAMAKFITKDSSATYDSESSLDFDTLTSYMQGIPLLYPQSQNGAWAGMIEYFEQYTTETVLNDGTLEVTDIWGTRCELDDDVICGSRYEECPAMDTCVPEILSYTAPDGTTSDVTIYEPCNFVSNLVFYRAIPDIANTNFQMGQANIDAYIEIFAALGFGSSLWHGSLTFLGNWADERFIELLAMHSHQIAVANLIAHYPNLDDATKGIVRDVHTQLRPQSPIEIASDMTRMFAESDVSTWTQKIWDLDMPDLRTGYSATIATFFTLLFPNENSVITQLMGAITDAFGVEGDFITTTFLPAIRTVTGHLNLTDDEKFVIFRQFLGDLLKMVFGFLWQEQTIAVGTFTGKEINEIGAYIMPAMVSLFNFISGFDHYDDDFQASHEVYPGDEQCNIKGAHAKWHELAAGGLLDLAFIVDCVNSITSPSGGFRCASLNGITSEAEITIASVDNFANNLSVNINLPFVEEVVALFIKELFRGFDITGDGKINWADIKKWIQTARDWVQYVNDFIDDWKAFVDQIEAVLGAFNCLFDSDCPGSEKCVMASCGLQDDGDICVLNTDCLGDLCVVGTCGKQGDGQICVLDSDCESGRCDGDSMFSTDRTCRATVDDYEACNENDDCKNGYCLWGTCGKQRKGEFCAMSSDCLEGRTCVVGTCGKQENGQGCVLDSDCESGRCETDILDLSRTCKAKKANGLGCDENSDCISGDCGNCILGLGCVCK
mmetsp:Transcript_10021/g.19122  ORF Transcript_10021/g.19122 Transcript_10021/m.19122 type:complete len:1267 (-) Transcript_10021:33-3833(-)